MIELLWYCCYGVFLLIWAIIESTFRLGVWAVKKVVDTTRSGH